MAQELARTEYFIKAILAADGSTTGIVGNRFYTHTIPQADPATIIYPCVLASFLSSQDVQPLNLRRAMTRALYQIVVMTQGPPDDNARTVADRIDQLIGYARTVSYTIGGIVYIFNGIREMPVSLAEMVTTSGGSYFRYHRLGGNYRIETYPG